MNPQNKPIYAKRKAKKNFATQWTIFYHYVQTHLRRLHGFETFGEVEGTLVQLQQLVRDPEEVVAVDGGLSSGVVGDRLSPKSAEAAA